MRQGLELRGRACRRGGHATALPARDDVDRQRHRRSGLAFSMARIRRSPHGRELRMNDSRKPDQLESSTLNQRVAELYDRMQIEQLVTRYAHHLERLGIRDGNLWRLQ